MTVHGTARRSGTRRMMSRWLTVGLLLASLASEAGGGAASRAPVAPAEVVVAEAARHVATGNAAAAIAALQALPAEKVQPAIQRQVDLLLGILFLRQERREDVIPRLERASTTYALLADYALWNLASAYRKTGLGANAAAALGRLIEKHPDSLFTERASREVVRDWFEAGDLARAEEAAGQYLAAYRQGPGRAEVWTTLGELFLRSGRVGKAEEVFRRVWIELPGSAESQRAKDLLSTIPGARPFSPDEQFQRATTLYQLGRYGQAVVELAPFAAVGNPKEQQARLLLGIGSFRLRQYAQTIQWLSPLRDNASGDRAEVLYWLARGHGRSGDAAQFTEYMTLVADTAPQSRRAEDGLYLLAQAAADNGDAPQARSYLARLLKEYPRGLWADDALWLQGWLAYKARDLGEAVAAWDRLLAEEEGSPLRTAALYWRGRALEAMKKPRGAAEAYRTILRSPPDQQYYWFRARERLGRLSKTAPRPAPTVALTGKNPARTDTLRTRKARALRALGLDDEAVDEYSEQVRAHPEDRNGLAETCRAFLDTERYDKAVWLAGQILRPIFVQENGRPPIRDFWHCLYPRGHWPIVAQQAARRGLDPFLVTALIREESAFAPRAVSSAGARGLMQLIPQTADQVARDHKLGPRMAGELESSDVNIQLGTIHLADLIRVNGGSLTLALAGYNAGQQQVQRWQDRFGFADEEEFTENIPYPETRNYVKRVLGSYQRYATLYGAKRAESREPRAATKEAKRAGYPPEAGGRVPSAEKQEKSTERREPRAAKQ